MLDADVFSHESPNGEAFDRRIRRFHVARQLGETIAWGSGSYGTPAGIVGMWLESPPHRAILLDRSFARIGVGRARGRSRASARRPCGRPTSPPRADARRRHRTCRNLL